MKNSHKLLNPKNINNANYIVETEGIDGLKESFRRYHCFCKDPEKLEQLVEKDMTWYKGQQNKEFKNMQYGFPKGFRM